MENTQTTTSKVWVSGDEIVRLTGEKEAHDYLHKDGYQAKLTRFIKERDEKLEAENRARKAVKNTQKPEEEMNR